MNNLELEKLANEIRKSIVTAVHSAKSGHPGGSLSSADIFTYLYFEEMNIDPKNPKMEGRDRFVLSKGHVAPAYYSTLAERGFFPKEDLVTLRHTGSYLQGHPDMKHIPGVDMSSGSLGQGVSAAVGMAAAGKFDNKDYRVYTLSYSSIFPWNILYPVAALSFLSADACTSNPEYVRSADQSSTKITAATTVTITSAVLRAILCLCLLIFSSSSSRSS
jgi:hypothetical protein